MPSDLTEWRWGNSAYRWEGQGTSRVFVALFHLCLWDQCDRLGGRQQRRIPPTLRRFRAAKPAGTRHPPLADQAELGGFLGEDELIGGVELLLQVGDNPLHRAQAEGFHLRDLVVGEAFRQPA